MFNAYLSKTSLLPELNQGAISQMEGKTDSLWLLLNWVNQDFRCPPQESLAFGEV